MAWSNHQDLSRAFGCIGHRNAIGQRRRHWLFDQYMPSGLECSDGLFGMKRVRRCDVDGLYGRISQQPFERIIATSTEFGLEASPGFRPRIHRGGNANEGMAHERGKGEHERPSQTYNPDAQRLACHSSSSQGALVTAPVDRLITSI